jgi:hypothetical protein
MDCLESVLVVSFITAFSLLNVFSINNFEVNASLCILKHSWDDERQELFELFLEADTNLSDCVLNTLQLWISFLEISINQALNKMLANFNSILLADFWLILH